MLFSTELSDKLCGGGVSVGALWLAEKRTDQSLPVVTEQLSRLIRSHSASSDASQNYPCTIAALSSHIRASERGRKHWDYSNSSTRLNACVSLTTTVDYIPTKSIA